jgi:DNA primase
MSSKKEKLSFKPKIFNKGFLMDLFEAARSVEMRSYVSQAMGLDMTKDGRILCPFHDDTRPSFSIKKV